MVWLNRVLVGRPAKGGKNGNEYGYFLTVLVYGVNFLVYMYLKINHIKDYVEKIAIYFGTNMTLLFTSSIFCFWKNSRRRHSGIRISRIFVESALLVIHYNYSQVANGQSKGAVQ